MTDDAPKPPAGWYPTPDGARRYWDGETWLSLPEPTQSSGTALTSDAPPARRVSRRRTVLIASVVVAALVVGGGGALAWKLINDQQAAVAAQEAADRATAKEEAAQRAADAKAAAAKAAEASERKLRADSVPGIEESIRAMAEKHIADEVIDGPVLSVDCSPVNGGSTDDLTEQTTVFSCFVANVDNGDGTLSGYTYNSTMNWDTGSYTYGIGAP